MQCILLFADRYRAVILVIMLRLVLSAAVVLQARGFMTSPSSTHQIPSSNTIQPLYNDASSGGSSGSMEEIEFRIYPDGRVTEVVRGVKGQSCEQVTAAINKQLGNVVDSRPTEEMYEQELVVDQTVQEKAGDNGGWDGASSW